MANAPNYPLCSHAQKGRDLKSTMTNRPQQISCYAATTPSRTQCGLTPRIEQSQCVRVYFSVSLSFLLRIFLALILTVQEGIKKGRKKGLKEL